MDVGGLRRGTRSIWVTKPREGADDLTLRAEEVRSLRTFIDTTHIELERWEPWMRLARLLSSHLPRTRRTMGNVVLDLHRAVGVKKPARSQKAKALWSLKAAKDGDD